MNIHVFNQQSDLSFHLPSVHQIVRAVLDFESCHCDEVNIYYVDAQETARLHEEFFGDPEITDCMSFPVDIEKDTKEQYRVLGDIFVCPYTAIEYAISNGGNPFYETTLYTVHALLHLLGYTDEDKEDRKRMKQAEARHMQNLKSRGIIMTATHKYQDTTLYELTVSQI